MQNVFKSKAWVRSLIPYSHAPGFQCSRFRDAWTWAPNKNRHANRGACGAALTQVYSADSLTTGVSQASTIDEMRWRRSVRLENSLARDPNTKKDKQVKQDMHGSSLDHEQSKSNPSSASQAKSGPVERQEYCVTWSEPKLFESLFKLAHQGNVQETYLLAEKMLSYHHVPPKAALFHALIIVNASPEGSVANVLSLLREMESDDIPLNQGICNAVLTALAIHPDYVLRTEILQHMEHRWFNVSDMGRLMVIVSMLREMQFEKALDELQNVGANDLNVPDWLYSLAAASLVEAGEFDEVMKVLRLRLETLGPKDMSALWTHVLDEAALAHQFVVCRYIWLRCVKPEYINVNSGTCSLILQMAARKGDVDFAKQILRVVLQHHGRWFYEHHELLVQTYANAKDYPLALKALVEMSHLGIPSDHSTTRAISMAMADDPEVTDATHLELFQHLIDNYSLVGKSVPIAAVNVLMEGCEDAQVAHEMYNKIRLACIDGPDLTTFHHQFSYCQREGNVAFALKLACEHKQLGFKPDIFVYTALISTLVDGTYDVKYIMALYNEMKNTCQSATPSLAHKVYYYLQKTTGVAGDHELHKQYAAAVLPLGEARDQDIQHEPDGLVMDAQPFQNDVVPVPGDCANERASRIEHFQRILQQDVCRISDAAP